MKKISLFLTIMAIVNSCSTNPLTGRKSLSLVSNSEIFSSSFQQYTEVKKTSKVISNTPDAAQVKE